MIEIIRDHALIGLVICTGAVGFWTRLFVDRHRKGKEVPAGEWIVFGIGWVALVVFLFVALSRNR